MIYLLDTNVCVRYLNGRNLNIRRRLDAVSPADIAVCSVVKAELFAGSARSQDPAGSLARQHAFLAPFPSLPFDDNAATEYGQIRAALEQAGAPIGPNDLLIAAICVANGLTLVTHNTSEFGRISSLTLEDREA